MEIYDNILSRWKEINLSSVEDVEYILSNFKVIFAYNSGKIENQEITYSTTLEIFEGKSISNFNGDYRTMYEMVNQKDCYEFLLEPMIQKRPLSIELIQKVQFELAKQTYDTIRISKGEQPGEFKKGYYVVGEYQVGCAPEEVEKNLVALIDEVNHYTGTNHITTAAYFHLVFERIHPFADGNGRTGRTLLNYYLMLHDCPPIVIHNENRQEYIDAFDRFHYDADITPMVNYLKHETVLTWKHLLPEQKSNPQAPNLEDFTM